MSPRAVLGRPGSCPGPKTLFPTRRSFRGGRSLGTPTPDLPSQGAVQQGSGAFLHDLPASAAVQQPGLSPGFPAVPSMPVSSVS